jgi:2-C-methyl-D-erythritol 4-phosphate cytidylyltransferase
VTSLVAGVIPAAGLGIRLTDPGGQAGYPKALRQLGGASLMEHAVQAIAAVADEVVIAAPVDRLDTVQRLLDEVAYREDLTVKVVAGGATRQESVGLALRALGPAIDFVLVHDAARPLAPPAMIRRVVGALAAGAMAVAPTLPVADSLRELGPDGVSRPVDRSRIVGVQTPQGFVRRVLTQAHGEPSVLDATDDATLVERLGVRVTLVDGDPLAFKITQPLDLLLAEAVLSRGGSTVPKRSRDL